MAIEDMGSLLLAWRQFLQSEDARQALDVLADHAEGPDAGYTLRTMKPASEGNKKVVNYMMGGRNQYAFIVNLHDLLFYYRKPSGRASLERAERLKSLGLETTSHLHRGELSVRLRSAADARLVLADCFDAAAEAAASPYGSGWTDDELRAAVGAYREIQAHERAGKSYSKAAFYRALEEQFGRTAKSFELRLQNVSAVLAMMGREWLQGLKPAAHVGAGVAARIEAMLVEQDGAPATPTVAHEIAVREARRKRPKEAPKGVAVPSRVQALASSFVRDPAVKGWVLNRAAGHCECCGCAAPFVGFDGEPFLEVHHLRTLAEQGSDTVSNAAALCPNCHRRLHFGIDAAEQREQVYRRVPQLIRE